MKVYPYFRKPATRLCRFSAFHSILWSRMVMLFVVVTFASSAFVNHTYAAPSPVPPLNTFTFYQNPGTYNYVIPPGVTSITVEVWGGGGRGGSRTTGTAGTGGGGGGAYSRKTIAVTPGQIYVVNVGAGSTSNSTAGGDSWVSPNTVGSAFVLAKGGNSAASNATTGATGGASASGIGDVRYSGGNGADAPSTTSSGGGGSSAGISANGTNASGTTGGIAPLNGGNGANGRTTAGSGTAGSLPGGGGSGAVRGTTGSPAGGAGAHGKVQINLTFDVNAGPDQTQCNNALFEISTASPIPGYSLTWSVVSGSGLLFDNAKATTQVSVPAGSSTTIRLTITDGTTTITDDVVLSNTTSCSTSCTNPININGDLEQQGTANAYNLSFQGTPATLIYQNANPVGWAERYGSATPNTSSFTGAYYLNKTGVNGDPHGGSKFIYIAGEGYCLSNLKTWQNINCGKTYRVSVWVAAYSNTTTQSSAPFAIEFFAGGPNVPEFIQAKSLRAAASTSWNNLNWQRYSFEFTIPTEGYEWADFLFTTYDNTHGIVIDDMCIEEVFSGAYADAGPDQFKCDNSFTMAANTPASGFDGAWSVVSGSASISNTNSPSSVVALTSGNVARLRWTVSKSETSTYYAIHPEKEGGFESCCSPYDNGWTTVNNGTNNWVVGSGGGETGGTQAAYISNNGGTSASYNTSTVQTSHLYRDVTIHPNATNINLQFDWQNLGESGYDRLLVYTAPTTLDPAAGTPASNSTTLTGATLVSTLNLHSRQHFTNELISLPASLAGTTFRLIFTWQNDVSGGTSWLAAVIDNVSLSYNLTTCNDFDEMTIATTTGNNGLSVNNANICPGGSATITATGCNAGNLLWNTGAITNSITVSPTSTTNYSVTCTPSTSANLLTNGNFESTTNLQGWSNWDNASITTNPSDVYAGTKAVFLNGSVSYAGVAQGFATTPGQRFRVRFYAKTTNSNALPLVRYHIYDNISNVLDNGEGVHITSTNYQLYEFFVVTPPNTSWFTLFAETSDKGGLFVDNVEVVSVSGCTSTALATVTVGEVNLTQNPEFNSGITPWELYLNSGSATLNLDNTSQLSGTNSARINITTATGTNWHIQFAQPGLNLIAGKTYTLSFRARAASARVINASVDLGQDPWTNYFYQDVNLTTSSQLFTYTFTQSTTTTNAMVVFNLGQSNQTVWIDDVIFQEVCPCIVPAAPVVGTVTQPTCAVPTGSVILNGLPSSGSWTLTRTSGGTTYTGSGTSFTVTGLPASSTYTFTVTNSSNCTSTPSANVVINAPVSPPTLGGATTACIGATANVTPATNGTWTSSNTSVATITNAGLVSGLAAGTTTLTYTRTSDGCTNTVSFSVEDCTCPNFVNNPEFNSGNTDWHFFASNGSSGTFNVDNTSQLSGNNSARINISAIAGSEWDMALYQDGLSIQSGKLYEVSFMAKASSNRNISAVLTDFANSWNSEYWEYFNLTTTPQTFKMYWFSDVNSNNFGFRFNLGAATPTVWIDNIVFKEVCPNPITNWNYSCTDNKSIEIIGRGRECQQNTSIALTNTSTITNVYVEAVYKTSNPGPTITFRDAANNPYTAYRLPMDPGWQQVWVYRAVMPATSSVNYTDNSTHCNLQSVVVYAERNSTGNTQSNGYFTAVTGYNDIKTFNFSIPTASISRNITLKLPISELTNDGRYLKVTATAGSVSNTTFVYGPDPALGTCCLNIVQVTLNNVPGSVSQITVEVDTRNMQNGQSVNGQSYVLAGSVNAEAVCNCPSPPSPPAATGASRCGAGSVTLTASGCAGGTIHWYSALSGGSSLGTGTTFVTPSLTSTTTYYAACLLSGCESSRTAVVATINPISPSITGNLNICNGNSTTLTASGGGTYLWSTGATSAAITVSPVSNTSYVVTVTNGSCSGTVSVTVNITPTCCEGPATSNVIAKYNFSEGTGSVVNDVSGFGTPLNLTIQNPANTTWVTGCGLRINSSTRIASTGNATKIRTALQATNAMTVEAWVQAANTTQNGPARIVSMSSNTSERNFTLGQVGTVWAQRTRSTGGDTNGNPERQTTANSANTNLTHLVFTRDASGVERIYINGVQNSTWTLAGNFSNWADFALHLGNEQSNDRTWLGTLYGVTIYSNALTAAQVTQNFNAGSKGDCSNCPPPDCTTQICAPLSCPSGNCYTNNLIVNPDFETNVNNWIASNGQVSQGGGGRYGNFIQVNVSDLAGTYTAYQDVNFGAGQAYRFEGNAAKHGVNNNAKVYLEFYNGSTYLSKTADFNVTMNFDGWNWENFGFQGVTPANTTKIRIVAWCNGNTIKMDKVSLIGCTNITATANSNNVCVGSTINLTSSINLNNANPVRQLVSNGDFVSGSVTGFSTDVPSGSFGFTTNPQFANGSWVWGTDNTTGSGNMMWFSDDNAASNRRQWYNTYSVVPNTTYTLSFWVRNIWSGGSNPTLFWTVNGTQVGSTITPAFGSNWVQLSTTWNSGSNTSATFAVVLQTNSWNFDFALDDISITGTETTYLWSGPNSYSSSLQNNNLTNAISSMAGTYSVITSAGNGCTASSNVNVVVNSNNTVTTNATRTLCVNTALSPTITHTTTGATGIGTPTGLPAGVTASWASNTITISGTPTASGTFNYTIPLTGGCGAVNATGTITVTANNSATTNATRTLCVNTALSPTITHTTTGATGIGTATGLPAGVTATWASNIITISGTPTASGTFNYTIPLTGGCGVVNATGIITVTANNTATTNATRTLCVNTALSPTITHTTTGATGIGTATGLPVGVTAAWASNTITISGTPTASGTFNYTIPLTGGCGAINATGTITVTANNTVTGIGSATTCINTAITTITHTTTGATGIGTATGLPAGVTAAWASNTITISGTPTASGTFNYTIPLTGGCGAINATGTITVTANNTVTGIGSATTCINTAITTITHTTTGATGIGTATGLPAGVTAAWASNTITISGTPTASGTFNYTIPLTGGCGTVNATGTITVTANNTATTNATRTLCVNTALSPTITHTTTGATGIGTATGLPAGVTATWASNTITISGTPTASGTFNYTIPLTGGCGAVNATGTITVTANNTVTGIGSATTCINTAITTITQTTTGATGIGTATGLPAGVTATWASNTITISGTPTASGTFNYMIPLTGGCGAVNATGTITVTANNTATTNSTRTLCVNTALSPTITHTTAGATGIGTATGLPSGVTAAWASNTITISGTPTASGTFNYTIPLTGGCGAINATGTITVTANNTVTTNAARTLCVNTALSPTITHTTTGATGIGTATGLPAGVTAAWASNTITISGTPTASGTFNYTIPLTGGCGAVNATGTITVTANNTVTGIGSATTCINTAITTITHTTTGATGIGTATGLPAGVTATWASNTITISGTPTASGTFNYTIPLTGGCGAVNAIGTITVNANPTAPVVGTITQPTCTTPTGSVVLSGLPSTGSWTISRTPGGTTYNGTGTSFTVTGLPVNTTYTFTVTNSNTCTSPASANVAINPIPSNPTLGGASAVCIGSTAIVTPATAGTWTSSNNSVASITNAGLVTGVTAGSVTLTYTRTSDGCSNTRPFTVNSNPTAPVVGTIIQPTCSTPAGSVVLSGLPATGNWTITRTPGGITYTGTGANFTVTGLPVNTTYNFTITNQNNCTSLSSADVSINQVPGSPVINGASAVCTGSSANITPASGGTWTSSNTSVATITNAGVVTGVTAGSVTLTYTRTSDGCSNTRPFTVNANPSAPVVGTITQPTCTTPTGSVVLSSLPATGSWTITRTPGGTTYTGTGTSFTVTGLPVSTTYTFTGTNSNLCTSPASANVAINAIPGAPVLGGATAVCVGSTANVTPATGGTWVSSNTSIVSITNAGLVTGVASGSVTLTYTRTSDGCSNTLPFTVNANPTAPIVGTITQPTCTTPTGSVVLSGLPATGSWTITRTPGGTTYNGTGTSFTITGLPVSTTYTFTVTNSNTCTSPSSANVTINAIPSNPTLGGASAVCVGSTANVTPATGGTWVSSNTSFATITNAGLVTGVASGSVTLTYTRTSDGCSNTLPFTVNANPTAPIVGTITQPTCTTPTGSVVLSGLPATGSWTITRTPGGTIYSGTGTSFTVTGLPVSTTYTFTVTNSNICTSPASTNVAINAIPSNPTLGGASAVCVGSTANVTPATGGTWVSSNTSFATITNAGLVTGVATGSVTLTYTRTSDGCSNTRPFTVNTNPTAPIVGTITQPTCTTPTGSVVLSGLPATGSWTITRTPGGVTYNGSGSTFTVTNLSPDNNFTFILTNVNGCSSPPSNVVNINSIPSIPTLGGDNMVCVGGTAIVTPTTNGTWSSSNTSIATITNEGLITGIAPGMVVLTFTRNSNGCSGTREFTVYAIPNIPVIGAITQPNCAVPTGSVVLNNLPATGNYTINQSPGGISYNASGSSFTINGLSPNTNYTFTVTSAQNCTSPASAPVNISGIPSSPSVSIDYNGSVCFETNKQLSALVSGGVGPFSYSWTGPSGFTANSQNVQIPVNGNYFVTVTDVNMCTAVTSGFVYQRYEPFVVSLQTRVCEGQNVTLDVNSPSAVSYLWGSNAGNGTTKMVTVTPQVPSSTYLVTVTNDLGCTAVPQITIQVDPRPIVSITGSNIICQEQTTQLSPSTGGTWVSTNPGVATINNSGLVTGVSAGTATFVFTSSTTNCASHPSAPVTVHAKPVVVVTGPNPICIGQTTTLSPSTGGTWTSSNVAVATVNNSGIVTGISTGSVTFTYTNTSTSCVSNESSPLSVQTLPSATITGDAFVCESSNIILNASVPGGTWTSSNHAVAVINNSGIVSGISQGTVTITYQYGTGVCSGQVQKNIEVLDKPTISYTGDQTICVGQTTTLSSGQSGNWTSSNPMIATISQSGVVTGVSGGMATFTFQNLATGCLSDASEVLTVYEKPTVSLTGPSTICLGSTTQVTPSSGGVWISSNPLVATITNNGVITSTGIGTTSFTFTDNLTGCSSDGNISVTVGAALSAAMDYHGSICLTDTSKLSVIPSGGTPAFSYQWVGPLGFTGNTQTIDINTNGNYFVTITDALGCKANLSGFVYQRFDPFIVNLSSSVCEGQSVNLSVNAPTAVSYLWSSNASNAVTSSVQVIPVLPSSTYFVTVTNNLGCKAVANASVLVNPKPVVNITGGNTICIGQTTTMSPSSGGSWVALHPSVATISQTGIVTGTGFGNARFLFTNTATGCTSDTSGVVSVHSSTTITFVGPSSVCAGDQTSVSPGSGGSWVSSNSSVATVNNAGVVVAVSPGVAQLTYTNNLGCTTNGSLSVTVHDKPAILLDGPSQICIGSTTRFLPSNGGTWTTSHASIASINNSGLVTGISQGVARFVYTNAFTGCKSDSSALITVLPRPVVQITGNNPICVGSTTTLSPNTGGMWMSSNPSVANVTNAGLVTGLGQGNVTFTFTNNTTGCSSLPTAPLTVNARPVVSVTGPNGICIGGTTTLSPSAGGTWTVVNPSVASVTNAGLVTGLAAGSSGFIFTNTSTGCVSNATNNVTVYGRPVVNINSNSICVGTTTTVTPSTGGTWSSSNPAVATVNGSGLVSGLSAGTVTFTFTENSTGCVSNPTSTLQVFGKPVVSITGPTNICVGQTTTLQPISGGAWSSLSPSVATVSNSGIVTGVANGSAQFVFTSNQGCASDPSGNITVNARPVITITGPNPICIGGTTQLSPASGGTWVSSHPSVASVNNAGLVTGVAAGGSRFVFTQTSTGCSSDSSSLITVNAPPVVNLLGSPSICIGQTSQVSPTAGGTWMSLNPTIATVSNGGLVTGVSAGQASFRFVQTSTGCENTLTSVVTVRPRPDISLSGPSQICIGATTQFIPGSGGSWTSLMPSVATINVSGMVTGISQGQATFRFTSASTGCTSLASVPVTVLGRPTVLLDGPNSICIGNNTQVLPNSGGSWTSTNPLVATVNLTGLVTGVGAGTAQFIFTDENTGCVSNPTTAITVFNGATVNLSGPSSICTGYNTTLSSSTSGVWYSTNPMIAKVSSNGMVTGVAPGKVSFYFQQSGTGCLSYLPDDILTVTQCTDADFNVTAVNVPLTGDVHTNDEVPVGTTYSTNPYLVAKPDGSLATLTMSQNGKYSFIANQPGEYVYNVPVCIPVMGSSCPANILVISVVNPFTVRHNIVTNLDVTYTIQDQPVVFNAQVNDDCISASECIIDPSMMSVVIPPNHGTAVIQNDGSVMYTPVSGFIGFDTLTYQICATNDSGNCRSAQLIVTVMSSDASNSLAAADDFYAIPKGGVINDANVSLNDFDPEGGKISIIPQGSVQNPVVSMAGSYHINSDGVLHFVASPTFTGPFDIVYTLCDSVNFCVNATVHILVVDNMKLRIRAYLEGALMENKDAVSSTGRPLMRDDLRNNKFTNSNLIPNIDPYSNPVGFIDISHRFDHVGPSGSAALTTIQHPNTVFAVTGENAIVDWVFIELRSKENYGEVIGTRSALLQRDGDVVDLDGISFVEFPGLKVDSCYVVLKHRNHLGVMSLKIATSDLVDFTSPSTPVFDYGTGKNDGYDYSGLAQKADVALGYMSLWAGDFDGNGKIKFVNPDDDQNFLFIEVLFYPTNTDFVANYNFVHGYLQGDYDLNGKSKYDNPDDDKNMLFYQVLFHPLNTNYTSNFNFITEQVPPKNIN